MSAAACKTCGDSLTPGAPFCDGCGASSSQVQVARKLRQASFDSVSDSKGGLLSPGERLKGRHTYVIEEAIARSGFGATFRASRTRDGQQVLIKQMLEQSSYDDFKAELVKSFKREAKFLRRIKHPAFPRGYEYFVKNKSFYLVMDFINGKELAKAVNDYRTKNGKVESGLVLHLGAEIADALEVIHKFGYIYRDLKPQNVMLDGIASRVKLIDFGTLYHPSDSKPLIFESPGYTPDEFKTADKPFVASGDVFSLGALMFELAVGATPDEAKMSELKSQGLDEQLIAIIEKCLQKDPEQRYQKARHVRDALLKLSRKGIWPFSNRNAITPVELEVLPKTLYPAACTFCEYCGHADPKSQFGYCINCKVPLQVGRLEATISKNTTKEFFLYSDETTVGSSNQAQFSISDLKKDDLKPKHFKILRIKTSFWLEALHKPGTPVKLNHRQVLGPTELIDGDTIRVGDVCFRFSLRDAC